MSKRIKLGLLHTTIRGDEKLLIEAAGKRNVNLVLIDVREQIFGLEHHQFRFDIVLERCVSTVKGDYAIHFFENIGIPTVNKSTVASVCEDKFLTSLVLEKNKVPTPKFALVFSETTALEAIKKIGGFPVVVKPPLGSWGRLLAKVNDRDSLEAILEHKLVLGTPPHSAFYIQKYVEKAGRDIRAFVIDGQVICAIYRNSEHWITNTARGGKASNCPVNNDLQKICRMAADAVGGGVLAMDIFETDDGFTVNEINHTMEFKNSEAPTGVSISGAIIDYCLKIAKQI
jgi:[lysine-biosynthesis-protein LysW]--L-2-aminoadipate ligase